MTDSGTGSRRTGRHAAVGILCVALISSGLATLVFSSPVSAATAGCNDSWVGPTTGVQSWANAANWSNGVPDYYNDGPNGNRSNACIDLPGTYTVDLATAATTYLNTINIGGSSGTQTLQVDGGANLDVSAPSAIHANGAIDLHPTSAGSAILSAGTYTGGAGTLSVASGGSLSTTGTGGLASVSTPVSIAAGATMRLGAPLTNFRYNALIANHGAVTIGTGAVLDLTSGASFTNAAGTLTVDGRFQMADGTFTASGGAESGNPVTLLGGTLADSTGTGAFDVTGSSTLYGDVPAGQSVTVDGVTNNVFLTVPGATTVRGTLALHPSAAGFAGITGNNGAGSVHVGTGGVFSSAAAAGAALALLDIPVVNDAGGSVSVAAPSTVFRYGANASNNGTLSVLDGGHLDMSGTTLTNTATGTIGVSVNANNATVSGISGTVSAAGTLAVQTIGAPAPGATFDPLTGPVSGTFAFYSFGSHAYAVTYPAGTVRLTAVRAPGTFVSLSPARVLDTRTGLGGSVAVPAGTVPVQVAGRGGVPSSGVSAVVLNVTVVSPTRGGYITAYPDGTSRPKVSNLNFAAGQTVPNLVVVPVGPDGKVALYNGSSGSTQLLADVAGYFLSD